MTFKITGKLQLNFGMNFKINFISKEIDSIEEEYPFINKYGQRIPTVKLESHGKTVYVASKQLLQDYTASPSDMPMFSVINGNNDKMHDLNTYSPKEVAKQLNVYSEFIWKCASALNNTDSICVYCNHGRRRSLIVALGMFNLSIFLSLSFLV